MIKSIPLSKLTPSTRNVRRGADEQADLQLKADVAARGLLQNLVVAPAKKPRGTFTVEAGGRRLRALKALAEEGMLETDHEVPCLVVGGGAAEAHEASLAENFQRLAMNPADECLAFGQLVAQGAEVEAIARRFGVTVRFVDGRLRLSALAPAVFQALGSGEISLDVAKAYATTGDCERQAWVFDQLRGTYSANHAESIRRMMTQATVSASDRRARFVGEEAYVAAGGRIERDLFAEADEARWLDVALLERLATEKMEALAASAAAEQGLAFVRPTLDSWIGYPATDGLRRVPLETPPLTDEESARIAELEEQIGELVSILENEESDEGHRSEAEEKIPVLDSEIDAITDKPALIDDELKGKLGAFLLLDSDGEAKLDRSRYVEITADEEDDEPGGDRSPVMESKSAQAPESPRPAGLPRGLIDELAIQRRDILAVHVTSDPGFALDLATFLMVDGEAGYASGGRGSTLSAAHPSDPVFGFKTPEARATIAQTEATDALDRSWAEGSTRAGRFDAFRALPDAARAAWLGHAVAQTLEASAGIPGCRSCAFHDHLGALLKIDVAGWWRPTGANYFDRVPKSVSLAALTEVGGPTLAGPYAKAKKAELAQACERIFAGDFIAEARVKQAALAWVPEAMRFAGAEPAVIDSDETLPWEEEPASGDCRRAEEAAGERQGGEAEVDGGEPSDIIEEAA